jgi:asparagine synthase (glutamine-hydrolysing)
LKLNKGWTKYILRKSMFELPEEVRWRRDKQGFATPEEVWLKTNFRPLIEDVAKHSLLQEMGVIDSKLFLDYYHMFLNGKKNIWHADISSVLIAELWLKMFFENGFDNDSPDNH